MAQRHKNRDFVDDFIKGETDYSPSTKPLKGKGTKIKKMRKDK